ncbi:MAG TPA: DUF362 domain-containing protein [Candidatus Krumholzibacterium sp.]|nr:DUF362 domain-containing protein [Candidatus Krumholzibacterium sp.]
MGKGVTMTRKTDDGVSMSESANKTGREKTAVSVTRCDSYELEGLVSSLREVLDPHGGMATFVGRGQRVLLKPNLLSAKAPERAITTHPNVIEAVARLVIEAGGLPVIGDSPGGAIRGIGRIWKNTGVQEMAERAGLELVNFEASGLEEVQSAGYRLYIARPVLDADVIINLAKLKTHTLTLLTCGVKNVFGVVPGFRKAEYHKIYPKPAEFAGMIVGLYDFVRPSLTIVDGILSMEGNGPSSGTPRNTGLLLAGRDAVAVDTVAARMIGFDPRDIDTIRIAAERGVGETDPGRIEVTGSGTDHLPEGFVLPSNRGIRLIPRPLARMIAPFVWLRLVIQDETCTRCEFCLKSCPVKAIYREEDRVVIDQAKCIQCMCCHELCPESSIEIKMSFLARLFV